jgi:hypothetical protein
MGSNGLVCSHDNKFNRAVLGNDAFYFSTAMDVAEHLRAVSKSDNSYGHFLANNTSKIKTVYTCENIVNQYASHFESIKLSTVKTQPALPGNVEVALFLENA